MNEYEERELEIEVELVGLERSVAMTDRTRWDCHDMRRKISDLKHELWQSRL
jgi:hypothetical protein